MNDTDKLSGLQYMAVSAFFFSLMGMFVKWTGERLPSQEIVFFRVLIVLSFSYWALRRAGDFSWGNDRKRLIFRGIAGFCALSCFYYALTHLPLADATLLHFTSPVFTGILAALFLGERLEWTVLASMGLSLIGVVLITEPSFIFEGPGRLALIPVIVGICGALFSATAHVLVRRLRKTEDPMTIVFYFHMVAAPAALPTALPSAVWPTAIEWVLLLAIGVVTFIAQVALTEGLHRAKAGRASAITYLQVVFAYIWGIVVFGEYPTLLSMGGALCIIAGILLCTRSAEES